MTAVAIIPVEITLRPNEHEFEVRLAAPAAVRSLVFMVRRPQIMIAANAPQLEERPVMFVEVDPEGPTRVHRFALVPTNMALQPGPGRVQHWAATGMSPHSGRVAHLFELVEVLDVGGQEPALS